MTDNNYETKTAIVGDIEVSSYIVLNVSAIKSITK